MDKIGFLFQGQGSQEVCMGKDFYENFQECRDIFNIAEKYFKNIKNLCFEGSLEDISQTKNTQPCLFVTEFAITRVLLKNGIIPFSMSGFSLGEITALCVADCFDFETGLKIVIERARLMSDCSLKNKSKMIAVLKLEDNVVKNLCSSFNSVYPVNYNYDGQVVISCLDKDVNIIEEKIKNLGGRSVVLKVSGGFHSPFMKEAAEGLYDFVKDFKFNKLKYKVFSNKTALLYDKDVAINLKSHIESPVLFKNQIKNMILSGVNVFCEIGPSKILSTFVKKIDKNIKVYTIDKVDNLNLFLKDIYQK